MSTYVPSDETMLKFFECAEEIHLKPNQVLIGYGDIDPSLYIVKEGLLQILYFDGDKEVTFGMASSETILCSPVMQIENCKINTTVLKIPQDKLNSLLDESHDFAKWMFNIALGQFYYSEHKITNISGQAEERYKNLLAIRPDIVNAVSANRLASYLGVTPSWFYKIRKKILFK